MDFLNVQNEDICKAAVEQNGNFGSAKKDKMDFLNVQNEDICKAAVEQNGNFGSAKEQELKNYSLLSDLFSYCTRRKRYQNIKTD